MDMQQFLLLKAKLPLCYLTTAYRYYIGQTKTLRLMWQR